MYFLLRLSFQRGNIADFILKTLMKINFRQPTFASFQKKFCFARFSAETTMNIFF